jgi:threonine dehydrogenase-like Zn-dependent dehydrogenase
VDRVLASVVVGPGRSEIQEFPLPEVSHDSALLKIEAAGVCGSDVAAYWRPGPARVLGHENVGRIVHIGDDAVRRWGVEAGDRVAVEEYLPCGHCARCRTTDFRMCAATDSRGGGIRYGSTSVSVAPSLWGGYSQYLYLHPHSVLHKVSDEVPAEQLALALPIANGYEWSYVEGAAGPGKSVVVIGPGQQGLACALAAKIAGAEQVVVLGLARDAHRLRMARRLGADLALDIEEEDPVTAVHKLTGGKGADLVIDTARGDAATLGPAAAMIGQRGTVLLSTAPDKADGLPMRTLQWKCATVKGVRGHSYAAVRWALDTITAGRYPLAEMCSQTFGIDEVDLAIRATGGETDLESVHVTVDPWRVTGK